MLGNVLKDSEYRNLIDDAIRAKSDHPKHHGITMQAHHAISAKGVRLSGLGEALVNFGYNINFLPNLVFIPSTIQGACHLGVQPHRGDHITPIGGDGEGHDDEPATYHKLVQRMVLGKMRYLEGKCPQTKVDREVAAQHMNGISASLIDLIDKMPALAPLTKVASAFGHLDRTGCSGADSVGTHTHSACPVQRDHEMREGPQQKGETITYKKPVKYELQAGH